MNTPLTSPCWCFIATVITLTHTVVKVIRDSQTLIHFCMIMQVKASTDLKSTTLVFSDVHVYLLPSRTLKASVTVESHRSGYSPDCVMNFLYDLMTYKSSR